MPGEEEAEDYVEEINETVDVFVEVDDIEDEDTTGSLKGNNYVLEDSVLSVYLTQNQPLSAYATVYSSEPEEKVEFKYNANGLRTQKKHFAADGSVITTDYTLHGKLITHLTKRVVDMDGVETSEELHFFYDAQSRPAMVEYNGAMYSYLHNLQGDIIGIVDSSGNLVVEYKYDAWGKPIYEAGSLLSSLGNLNPFRYRGYVWDEETELYYLRSRFYNAKISRFINSDTLICSALIPLSCNVYSYCRNNSVLNYDSEGLEPHSINTIPKDKITVEKIVDESDLGYGYTCVVEEYRVWIPFDMIDKVITDYVLDDKEGLAEDFQFVVEDIVLPYASSKITSIGTTTEFFNAYMTVVALCEMIRKRILTDAAKKARNEAKEKETGVVYIVRTTTVKGGRPIVPATYESMEEWSAMMKKTVETR